MIWALILLQLADAVSTVLVLREGGYEKNPVVRWAMSKVGMIPALAATKIPTTALAAWALQAHPIAPYIFAPVIALYVWVVTNNLRIYRRLTKD